MKKYIFFSGFIFLLALFSANSWADNTDVSPWTLNKLVIDEVGGSPDVSGTFYGGNVDCADRKVITEKELKVFGVKIPFLDEHSHDACTIKTKFGFWSNSSYLTRNGTDLGGQIYFANNHRSTVKGLTPIPNSDKVLLKTQQGIKIINNFDSHLTSEYNDTTVKHYLDSSSGEYLTDLQGNKINVELYPVAFSTNGRWLVSESSAAGSSDTTLILTNTGCLPKTSTTTTA